jgi:hypothetical protein
VDIEKQIRAHTCPCCGSQVEKLNVGLLVDICRVSNFQARILQAVWRGKGHPVPTERIFDVMYADDPDGGPSRSAMYNSFKVALCRLRKQIEGTGIGVENVGYGRGYRLVMNAASWEERLKTLDELHGRMKALSDRERTMQKTLHELRSRLTQHPTRKLPKSLTQQLQIALAA